jgi:hypothetical protein
MEALRTSETSVDNYFTQKYIPEYNSEHLTRRRENLKSHVYLYVSQGQVNDCKRQALSRYERAKQQALGYLTGFNTQTPKNSFRKGVKTKLCLGRLGSSV